MILNNPSKVYKKKLEIVVSSFDYNNKEQKNSYLDPSKIDDLIITRTSSISTDIFKLKPDLNVQIFTDGKPTHLIISNDSIPKIIKNERLFIKLSKYKKRKLAWLFCKAVCSGRIKNLSRLNEVRKNESIKNSLKSMRELDLKLSKCKDKNEMMGLEGNIAKQFYHSLNELDKRFIKKRDREGKDLSNILMNFTHSILRNKIYHLLIINGINPSNGFLHGKKDRDNPYLVWDFAEIWIPEIDKLVFYMINKNIIKDKDISIDGRLNKDSIVGVINLINKRITEKEIDNKIKEFLGYLQGKNRISWKI